VGTLERYGLGFAQLSALNERLIYCSITGFGQTGPYAARAGYDYIIQGMSGLMDITGEPEREPQKVGVAVVDIFTGVYTATAILAAVHARRTTGEGCHIDMSLFDTATSILANQASNYLVSGQSPTRLGNAHPNIAPYQVFKVKDGHIIVAVGNDGQFQKLCTLLGRPDFVDDPRFATNRARVEHRATLVPLIAECTRAFTRAGLLSALDSAGVPGGPINSVADVFADPQVIARGMRLDLPTTDGSTVPAVRTPIRMSETPPAYQHASPRLGEHTAAILAELGYDDGDIDRLDAAKVVRR
jgi:crotonobetainyl-CoA:carnitine CoA-transferase CaiB-like acyl-CoA transferase